MKYIFYITTILLLLSCTSAGVKDIEYVDFEKSISVNVDSEKVWGYILEWSALKNLPIESVDKVAGLIKLGGSATTSRDFWGAGSANIDEDLVDCGTPTGNIGLYRAKFENLYLNLAIIIREVEDQTRITVNLSGTAGIDVSNVYGSVSKASATCASRGILEKKLFEDIRKEVL